MFSNYGLLVQSPSDAVFSKLRFFIESVKTDNISDEVISSFSEFLLEQPSDIIILGCTEFPVLYDRIRNSCQISRLRIYDPLEVTLYFLYSTFKNEINNRNDI